MATERNSIPVHKLLESTDQGFQIERLDPRSNAAKDALVMGAHRDDHYIFLVQESGISKGMVDFHLFTMKADSVLFVLPGQVHSYLETANETTGWFVAMDPGLIPDLFRAVLEDPLLSKKPFAAAPAVVSSLTQCLKLVHTLDEKPVSVYSRQAIYSLLNSFVAMVAGLYDQRRGDAVETGLRSQMITREFRKLLAGEYKRLKSPGEYAAILHLSASYLNEVVKSVTGFTMSHWIQQEVMLEAKRLLYHSQSSVKEIAYELGYEDHTYFSRLFKKTVGRTPGAFRGQYHK
jgi:AraC family transcriptional regulator, transcriptional activator of pobA